MSRLGRSLVVWAGVALATASVADDAPKTAPEPSEVRVQNIEVRLSQAGPVVLLRVGNKAVPVFVDALVAESIQGALTGQKPPRPLSHDLMHTILQALDAKVSQVVITQRDGIFYGASWMSSGWSCRDRARKSCESAALEAAARKAAEFQGVDLRSGQRG